MVGGDDPETRKSRMAEGVLQDRRYRTLIMKLGIRWTTLAKEARQEQQWAPRGDRRATQ